MIIDEHRSGPRADAPAAPGVRLGVIDYLNVRPVYDWILRSEGRHELIGSDRQHIVTVKGVPSAMNAAMADGALDISNVSSYAYGHQAANWLLIPRLSVAAHGRVDSVLLFSRTAEWAGLDGASIAVTDQSATSVALVRLLCEQRYGIHPTYVRMAGDLEAMLAAHDAALIIGDRALIERHAHRALAGSGVPSYFDLAAEWTAWTGLPFVFAVWAARAERLGALRASGVVDLLRVSKERGLARLDAIATESARRLHLPRAVCAEYLRLLDYDLSEQDLVGLRAFLEMAIPTFSWSAVRFYSD